MRSLIRVFCLGLWAIAGIHPALMAQHRLQLGLGSAALIRQDLLMSPLIQRDFLTPVAMVRWEKEGNWHHQAGLRFRQARTTPRPAFDYLPAPGGQPVSTQPNTFTQADVWYGLGFKVLQTRPLQIVAGLGAHADIDAMGFSYGHAGAFGYFAAFSANFWTQWTYQKGPHQLGSQWRLPLAAWIARSPYLLNDDEFIENVSVHNPVKIFAAYVADGLPVVWKGYHNLEASLTYQFRLNRHLRVGLEYRFEYLRRHEPLLLASLEHQTLILTTFDF